MNNLDLGQFLSDCIEMENSQVTLQDFPTIYKIHKHINPIRKSDIDITQVTSVHSFSSLTRLFQMYSFDGLLRVLDNRTHELFYDPNIETYYLIEV